MSRRGRPSAGPRPWAVALVASLAILGVMPAISPPVRAAEYRMRTQALYDVRPAAQRTVVTVDVTFTNTTPDPRGQFSVFEVIDLPIHPGATAVRARDEDGPLRVTRTERNGYLQVSVRPRERVRFRDQTTFTLTYWLEDGAEPAVQVGQSLVAFPAWGFGTEARVMVQIPGSFEVSVDGDELEAQRGTSGWILRSGRIDEPSRWLAELQAVGLAGHHTETRAVPLADGTVDLQVRSWADDGAWGERTLDLVSAALPLIDAHLGIPYPATGPLIVEESLSGAEGGLDGETAGGTRVLAGHDRPPFELLHQLGHVWLTNEHVADRWIAEGFASWAAAAATQELDVEAPYDPAKRRQRLADDGFPLVSWGAGEASAAQDAFAYAASWAVVDELVTRVGEDPVRQAWQRAAAGIGPYEPMTDEVPFPDQAAIDAQATDSRMLLDQLEAVSDASLAELFAEWVFDRDTAAALPDRAEARAAFAELLNAAGAWGAPDPVIADMTAWDFDSARRRMAEAVAWLAERDRLMVAAEEAGLLLPQRLRDRYRSAGGGGDAREELDAERALVDAYRVAIDLAAEERGLMERIGMLGTPDPDELLAEANAVFAEGDLRAAADATLQARSQLDHAEANGWIRLGAGVVVVLVLLGVAWALWRRRGIRHGSDYTAAP